MRWIHIGQIACVIFRDKSRLRKSTQPPPVINDKMDLSEIRAIYLIFIKTNRFVKHFKLKNINRVQILFKLSCFECYEYFITKMT